MEHYQLEDGSRNILNGYPFKYVDHYIWWNYYNNNSWQDRDKYTGSIALMYDITPWLNATGRISREYNVEQFTSKNKPIDFLGLQEGGYSNSLGKTTNDNMDFMMTAYKKNILKSDFSARLSAGASRWDYDSYGLSGASGTWYYPNMYTFFNYTSYIFTPNEDGSTTVENPDIGDPGTDLIPGEFTLRQRTNSVYSFLNLSYKDYLFVELTGRNDWSSTLPENNNSYFYPSASLSFIASEAFHLQEKVSWLNFCKDQGRHCTNGQQCQDLPENFYYQSSLFGGQQASYLPDTIPPIELRPQFVTGYEAGSTWDCSKTGLILTLPGITNTPTIRSSTFRFR
ncbi:MAG: TonB-dependent receptor [Bacteroidales bacterium]|nr:TonB-dependent receptor [Bacteroidales bacterium]